jgi:hypothetical protein
VYKLNTNFSEDIASAHPHDVHLTAQRQEPPYEQKVSTLFIKGVDNFIF